MNNIFGNQPVSGEDFHGRNEFIQHLKGILISKNSFILLGLRRTGKSSVLKEVVRLIKKESNDYVLIDLNCETYVSIQDLYKNIYLALPHSWRDKMRKTLTETRRIPMKLIDFITDHIEEVDLPYVGSVKLRNDAISYANPLKEELTAFFKKEAKHIILIVDELPFLFENISEKNTEATKLEIEMILTTLRSWRDIGISQAICGSLNLHLQLESLGVSRKLLGGLITQSLPKYTQAEAKSLLKKLALNTHLKFEDQHLNHIIELLPDCIPQFLQIFFFSLKTHWNGDVEEIKTIFNKYVYPVIVKDFEYQFNERFSNFPIETISIVKEIFNTIYQTPNISEAELLKVVDSEHAYSVLMKLATHEFIVMNDKNQFDFSFEIVRNWWRKKSL